MKNNVYMYSSIACLANGNYDGEMKYQNIISKGNHGIGTFNGLDGEMLAINGNFYKLKSDGTVEIVDSNEQTPYAVVCDFEPEFIQKNLKLKNTDQLAELVNKYVSTNGGQYMYAIKVEGSFGEVSTRTVSKQTKPYKKLNEASKEQKVFSIKNTDGSIFGFWTPKYLNTLSVQGNHFHFINEDKNSGGHLFDFKDLNVSKLSISKLPNINFIIGNYSFEQADVQQEIEAAERSKK